MVGRENPPYGAVVRRRELRFNGREKGEAPLGGLLRIVSMFCEADRFMWVFHGDCFRDVSEARPEPKKVFRFAVL